MKRLQTESASDFDALLPAILDHAKSAITIGSKLGIDVTQIARRLFQTSLDAVTSIGNPSERTIDQPKPS